MAEQIAHRTRIVGSGSQIAGTRSRPRQLGQHARVDAVGLASVSKQTSIRLRLRSNPGCNMKTGLLEARFFRMNTPQRATRADPPSSHTWSFPRFGGHG
jgi:hypothetical protein